MKIKSPFKDKKEIEGLPMRLIIILVIAEVVLAAIITMTSKTEGHMEIDYNQIAGGDHTQSSSGFLVKVDAMGSEEVTGISFTAYINITDTGGKAIDGAKVTVTGADTALAQERQGVVELLRS